MTSAEINSYAPAFKNEEMTKALAYAEPAPSASSKDRLKNKRYTAAACRGLMV